MPLAARGPFVHWGWGVSNATGIIVQDLFQTIARTLLIAYVIKDPTMVLAVLAIMSAHISHPRCLPVVIFEDNYPWPGSVLTPPLRPAVIFDENHPSRLIPESVYNVHRVSGRAYKVYRESRVYNVYRVYSIYRGYREYRGCKLTVLTGVYIV